MISEEELVNEYPEIFELWHKSADEIDGPPPQITVYGFQHGQGWNNIIESLCETLDKMDVDITVVKSKQKFGGLRFYHNGVSAADEWRAHQASGAIRHAEEMSFRICEECGDLGEHRTDGWFKTRCDDCYEG